MKQTDLINLLKKYLNTEMRKIVREEIKYSFKKDLRTVIREELELLGSIDFAAEAPTPGLTEIQTEESYDSIVPEKKQRKVENVKFSNDPLLNDILAETAMTSKPISEKKAASEFRDMNAGAFTSNDVMPSTAPNMRPTAPAQPTAKGVTDAREMLPDDRRGRDIPDFLQGVLTRDYSELTKAMSKPKSGGTPGMMPPM